MGKAYSALEQHNQRIYNLQHAINMLAWDSATQMPAKGSDARGAAIGELEGLQHEFNTRAELAGWLSDAAGEALDAVQQANLRETRRQWLQAKALPADLVQQRSVAASRCEHAWRSQRHQHDWQGFLQHFKPLLQLVRQEAQCLAELHGIGLYDALLDVHEPGLRTATVNQLFGEVRQWLPGLLAEIVARQSSQQVIEPQGPFPIAAQRALSERVMAALGFDFEAGRLDVSSHPFCGGVFEDVRLTTRYDEHDLLQGLSATIHETGHALYNMGLPLAWRGQPVGLPRFGALHESQALCFEKQIGFSPAFAHWLSPLLTEAFGPQAAFAADNLVKLLTRVRASLIRVDADEVSYPAHVILRYEIERDLIEGVMEAEDIPARWNASMRELLGIDPGEAHGNGCLQDMHWAMGLFGYFPSYLLGSMYAAQWMHYIRQQQPDLDQQLAAGRFDGVRGWLQQHIHNQGSLLLTEQLTQHATGEVLNPAYFQQHLRQRYLGTAA